MPGESYENIVGMVDDLIQRFEEMYAAFDRIVKRNEDIAPRKFDVQGWPHIDEITSGKSAV